MFTVHVVMVVEAVKGWNEIKFAKLINALKMQV